MLMPEFNFPEDMFSRIGHARSMFGEREKAG